jgi:hypothetical protein
MRTKLTAKKEEKKGNRIFHQAKNERKKTREKKNEFSTHLLRNLHVRRDAVRGQRAAQEAHQVVHDRGNLTAVLV